MTTPPNEPLSFEQWWGEGSHQLSPHQEAGRAWRARGSQTREELALKDNEISSLKSEILSKDNEIKELKALNAEFYKQSHEMTVHVLNNTRSVSVYELTQMREEVLCGEKQITSLKERLAIKEEERRHEQSDLASRLATALDRAAQAEEKLKDVKMRLQLEGADSYLNDFEVDGLYGMAASRMDHLAYWKGRAEKAEEKVRELSKVLNFIKFNGRPHGRAVWEVEIDPMIEKALSASDPVSRVDDVKDSVKKKLNIKWNVWGTSGKCFGIFDTKEEAERECMRRREEDVMIETPDVKDSEKDLLKARIAGLTGSLKISESRAEDLRAKLKVATDALLKVASKATDWPVTTCSQALAAIDKGTEHEKADKD